MNSQTLTQADWTSRLEYAIQNKADLISEYGFRTENSIFTENFIHNGDAGLTFTGCTFTKNFSLLKCSPNAKIWLQDCLFEGDVFFGEVETRSTINFLNCTIKGRTVFSDCLVSELSLNLISGGNIIFSDNCQFDDVSIGGMKKNKIDALSIYASIIRGSMDVTNVHFGEVHLHRSTLKGELTFSYCDFLKLSVDNFRNSGSLKFLYCESDFDAVSSEIIVNRSNLGKAEFFKFNFYSFHSINFANSVLSDCIFISCTWSKRNLKSNPVHFDKKIKRTDDNNKRIEAGNLREVYKQIKYAVAKQGDYVQEQFFHALEMDQYYRSLPRGSNFWTKIILKLSLWTSNYGQSFSLPLYWLFGINTAIFLLLRIADSAAYLGHQTAGAPCWSVTLAAIVELMNPLRKYEPSLPPAAFALDLASRIISSYLLYNIIRATRRFVK